VADWIAVGLGKFAHVVLASRRRIALDNLRRAFKKEKSEAELERITRLVFINIARTVIEFARIPRLNKERLGRVVPEYSGSEHLEQVYKEGKGAVMMTGHFGNWELLAAWTRGMGYPVHLLVGRQHNPYVDGYLTRLRKSMDVGVTPVGVGARQILRLLKENNLVAMVADQHSASAATRVQFFDRPAATPSGPAAFAVKLNCPLLFGYIVREAYNRHRVVIEPPIYPPESGDREKDIIDVTQQHTDLLEKAIRKYPDQWMWTHRRWKID